MELITKIWKIIS